MSAQTRSDQPPNCRDVWENMNKLLSENKFVRNYSSEITMGSNKKDGTKNSYTVETELFPIEALSVYSAYNLEDSILDEDRTKYFSAHRGGSQGDYREGMKSKIANVVDCLHKFPSSKRAVITIPKTSIPCHSTDDDAKCMREIHFYLDKDENAGESVTVLNATVWMRAQAAEIFPKNIHFVGSLMERVATNLSEKLGDGHDIKLGVLFYLATTLVSVRDD